MKVLTLHDDILTEGHYSLRIADGRDYLYEGDTGRYISLSGISGATASSYAVFSHYSQNEGRMQAEENPKGVRIRIPDELLAEGRDPKFPLEGTIFVWYGTTYQEGVMRIPFRMNIRDLQTRTYEAKEAIGLFQHPYLPELS